MKQREIIVVPPANDNPKDDRQAEMFGSGPIFIGVDLATGRDVHAIGYCDPKDGFLVIHEVLNGVFD